MLRSRQLPGTARARRVRIRSRHWLPVALLVATAACGPASGAGPTPNAGGPRHASTARAVLLSTQPVVLVPGTIDYTGKTDVTDVLQNFLDHLPDNRLVRFHRNGRYRIEGTLYVTDHNGLTFDGQNATFFATSRGTLERSQWFISGGGGIIFRHVIVHGANPYAGLGTKAYDPRYEKQHGFRIEGVQGIELDHVTVTDVYGDFVYIAREISQPATNVWIHDSTFRRNGREGIAIVCATGVIIERNVFSDTRRATIDLEPNGANQTDSDIFVLNNNVGTGRLFFVSAHGKGPVSSIVISGNQLHKHVMTIDVVPLPNQRRSNWIVTNNKSDTIATSRPMRFMDTDGVLVSGNTQPIAAKVAAVEFDDVCTGRVENNNFGTAGVLRHGATCSAQLVIPTQPAIPGRS